MANHPNVLHNVEMKYYRVRDRGGDRPRSKWVVMDNDLKDRELDILQVLGLDKKVCLSLKIYPLPLGAPEGTLDTKDNKVDDVLDINAEVMDSIKRSQVNLKAYFGTHGSSGGVVVTHVKEADKLSTYLETAIKQREIPYADPIPKPFSMSDIIWFLVEDVIVVTAKEG